MLHSKKFFLTIIITTLFSLNIFAIGAGIQVSGIPSVDIQNNDISVNNYDANLTGTFRLFRIPAAFGFGLEAGADYTQFVFGTTGFFDYIFLDNQIENNWNCYAGTGVNLKAMFTKDFDTSLSGGLRFFSGMNWVFLDNYIEYYTQIVLIPSYVFYTTEGKGLFRISIPVETGVRLHY